MRVGKGVGRHQMPDMQKRAPLRARKLIGGAVVVALLLPIAAAVAGAFRRGVVPPALNPLPALDLGSAHAWLVDWRLAALRYDPALCRRVLARPHIAAQPIADSPIHKGCGWINAVRMSEAGGIHASFDRITCQAAAALTLWLEHDVQPLAFEMLGQRVASVQSLGSYACRNIVGSRTWKNFRSQHALANAVDIKGFNLANGRHISVAKYWRGSGPEARFLHAVHARACRYFRVVLGPDHNAAHHDHFHLDRGPFTRCD
jgi:hypothetical protein